MIQLRRLRGCDQQECGFYERNTVKHLVDSDLTMAHPPRTRTSSFHPLLTVMNRALTSSQFLEQETSHDP